MSILDWSFVSLLSCALLFCIFGVVLLISFLRSRRKLKPLKRKRPPKNKKKRKQFIRMRNRLKKKAKRQLMTSIILLLLSVATISGALFSRNYQQNHLQGKNAEVIVQSYYLLDDLELQLQNLSKGESPQKSFKNIQNITSQLASYGNEKADLVLKEDGQTLLNRYYSKIRQLGINLHAQKIESLQKKEVSDEYLNDVKNVKKIEKDVFTRFKINEKALKSKK